MTRRAQIAISVAFVVVIATPGLLLAVGLRPENIENRATAPFPAVEPGSLVDDGFYAGVTASLTDRLPLRDRAIRANTSLEDAVTLTEANDPDQPRGSDGWLYHPETLLDECVGPPPDVFLQRADQVAELAESIDIPFAYFIAPDKVSIYPEHLPLEGVAGLLGLAGQDPPACFRTWELAIDEAADSRPWLDHLADDLRADLATAEELLFYKLDTHWTDTGSLNQVEAMVEYLRPGLWDPEAIQPTVPDVKKQPDSSILRGETAEEQVAGYLVERPGVTVEKDRAPIGREGQRVDVSHATSTGPELIEGTTVLLGDSFSRHTIELLAPYFEDLVWVSREYVKKQGLAPVVHERPTAILVEQVERNITKGWFEDFLGPLEVYLKDQKRR